MEPITRQEMYLAKAGGQAVNPISPITREEMFLAKLAGQDVATPEPYTRREMLLKAACDNAGGGSGGGAEIKTCTVRFVDGGDACASGFRAYTKYEDGVCSTVEVGNHNADQVTDFDITLENVVCGSLIYFPWDFDGDLGRIVISGSETATAVAAGRAINETPHFAAPLENGAVCAITLSSEFDDGGGMLPFG